MWAKMVIQYIKRVVIFLNVDTNMNDNLLPVVLLGFVPFLIIILLVLLLVLYYKKK